MKIVVQVKLVPDAAQAPALERTLHTVNECADRVSAASFEAYGLKGSVRDLRSMAYGELKARARKKAEIQAKQTRSAKQLLRKRARRESRHATHINHTISKTVVAVAQRTERGIALEQLHGIRARVTVRRDQRARQSSWPFHQLGEFIAYEARRAGVPFIEVDPAYTSQRCPRCGHTARNNRPSRDHFHCRRCGLAGPADVVAGVNVRDRARSAWVFVNMPPPVPT